MSDSEFHLVAIVRCEVCGEGVADLVLGRVGDVAGVPCEPPEYTPVIRWQVRADDADELIAHAKDKAGRFVKPASLQQAILADVPADQQTAWCSRHGDQLIDLRRLRAVDRAPASTPVKLWTMRDRKSNRR